MVSAELAVVTVLLSNRIHLTVVTDDFWGGGITRSRTDWCDPLTSIKFCAARPHVSF